VLEDPAVKESRSVTLLYGAQNPLGDTFHVKLAEPIDKTNPSFALNLGVGISYGCQSEIEGPCAEPPQYSTIEVDEKLMTSSAGGQDDCVQKYEKVPDYDECVNGELITVGGIGDSTEDPPDPTATPPNCRNSAGEGPPRCDDELYSLLPFVNEGESAISFATDNPSDNDNIFFAALEVHGGTAVIGEGVVLSPASATNTVGQPHTVTAKVQNDLGEPTTGAKVQFVVKSGPNEGTIGEGATNAVGEATFTYTSSMVGVDHLVASFTNSHKEKQESNEVSETWEKAPVTEETHTTPTAPVLPTPTSPAGPTPTTQTGAGSTSSSTGSGATKGAPPSKGAKGKNGGSAKGGVLAFGLAPVLGKTVDVEPISGTVFVKLPTGAQMSLAAPVSPAFESLTKGVGFVPLTEARQIPVGSTLDTRLGVVRLTTATQSANKVQFGDFGAGIFTILQNRRQRGLTTLKMIDGANSHTVCATLGKRASATAARLSSGVLGRLSGNAQGKFTTRGQYSAATVRGTVWSVANRCDGTLTHVTRGVVSVRDFARRKTITLFTGESYLARAP
jgi:hypothetical protein